MLMSVTQASAMGILQAYEAALQNDPTYLSAVSEKTAGQEYKVLGRSNLLPQLGLSYSSSQNRSDVTAPNFLGQISTSHPNYKSYSGALQLRQPLLNMDGVARYYQGIAQTNYSDAVFSSRSQDLLVRVFGAYVDAQYAEDQLALSVAQRDTYAEQKRVNERMFAKGEGTKTDMLETQAKYDVAEAQLIEANDNVTNARNVLESIVGVKVLSLDALSSDFRVQPMQPAGLDDWREIALSNNAEILAQRQAVESASQEVNKNRAGHLPRLDFVASYAKNKSDTLNTLNQESTSRTVGIQLNVPIYSGGSVSAATRQAVANLEKAKTDLEAKTKQVLVELRRQHSAVQSGSTKIDALTKSLKSAEALVEATRQSIKGGVRINLDLLSAEQQVFSARRDLAQAKYTYLLSYLKLRNAAGTLGENDLRSVAGYFVAGR